MNLNEVQFKNPWKYRIDFFAYQEDNKPLFNFEVKKEDFNPMTNWMIIDSFYAYVIKSKMFWNWTVAIKFLVKNEKHYWHFEDYFYFEVFNLIDNS